MIEISRCTRPEQIPPMLPYVTVENEAQRLELAKQVQLALVNSPETTLVVQALRDGELVGFIIAQATREHVWLAQAWSRAGNSFRIADEMWNRVLVWTAALGKTQVRAETRRSTLALFARFGFVELSLNIVRPVDPTVLDHIARSLNGKPVQATESDHAE